MDYISTRGESPAVGFEEVLLAGLAPDGGLYLPSSWPVFSFEKLRRLQGQPYQDIAFEVIKNFACPYIGHDELRSMIAQAYGNFSHAAVIPLKQIDHNLWILELFHGPTLAFKDVAMQLLARLMDWALIKRGEHATVVGATSGDTGSAAIEAFKNSQRADVFILHPLGKVSDIQRRQMTTVDRDHVHNIAVEGSFDDAQSLVKALFNDKDFRDRTRLCGVNSINWVRIVAQSVYYFSAALALGSPDRRVSFCVPTGNFGDIFAGFVAKHMGLPVAQLHIATNENNILDRCLKTGRYDVQSVQMTSSPSMDIQIASNFERLLYLALAVGGTPELTELNSSANKNGGKAVKKLMSDLETKNGFVIEPEILEKICAEFSSGASFEAEGAAIIDLVWKRMGELLDPHSAIAVAQARRVVSPSVPMISLATAHPAKFPDIVFKACGVRPALPEQLGALLELPEKFTVLPNNIDIVKAFILSHYRRNILRA